jgi:hypothetical protein
MVKDLLAKASLTQFQEKFEELGVLDVEDLAMMDEAELTALGLTQVQIRRMRRFSEQELTKPLKFFIAVALMVGFMIGYMVLTTSGTHSLRFAQHKPKPFFGSKNIPQIFSANKEDRLPQVQEHPRVIGRLIAKS